MINEYPLAQSSWGAEEKQAIQRVLSSGRFTMGSEVEKFESQLSDFHKTKHAIMVNSGSSANLISATALTFHQEGSPRIGVKRGYVIAPAVSWSTTYFPFSQLGYKIKLVDVDESFNIDVSKVKKYIDKDCRGIITVNILGVPARNNELKAIADKYKIFLFEDNCESFGAKLNKKLCGTFGHTGTLSFFFSHHLQTMEGGAILTDNDDIANLCRSLRAHGWTRDGDYKSLIKKEAIDEFYDQFKFVLPGYAVRPLEMSGAIGQSQLKKWPKQLKGRLNNAKIFQELCSKKSYIQPQKEIGESSWFGFGGLFSLSRQERLKLWKFLSSKGIESRPIISGNFFNQPVSKYLDIEKLDKLVNADKIHESGMFFGNQEKDLSQEIEYLFKNLDAFFKP
jgi:CDP-6-deoxy-D-xylo-4-hexulose-3-dehydrase